MCVRKFSEDIDLIIRVYKTDQQNEKEISDNVATVRGGGQPPEGRPMRIERFSIRVMRLKNFSEILIEKVVDGLNLICHKKNYLVVKRQSP